MNTTDAYRFDGKPTSCDALVSAQTQHKHAPPHSNLRQDHKIGDARRSSQIRGHDGDIVHRLGNAVVHNDSLVACQRTFLEDDEVDASACVDGQARGRGEREGAISDVGRDDCTACVKGVVAGVSKHIRRRVRPLYSESLVGKQPEVGLGCGAGSEKTQFAAQIAERTSCAAVTRGIHAIPRTPAVGARLKAKSFQ